MDSGPIIDMRDDLTRGSKRLALQASLRGRAANEADQMPQLQASGPAPYLSRLAAK
jgi:hypothetical protein